MGISSLITTVIGTGVGVLKDLIATAQKNKAAEREALLKAAGMVQKDKERATTQLKGKGVQFTRRIIVCTFMFILAAPVIMWMIDPDIIFYIPVVREEGAISFLFGLFSSGPKESIEYIGVHGFVYLTAILDMVGFIVGFYFGNGGTKTRI